MSAGRSDLTAGLGEVGRGSGVGEFVGVVPSVGVNEVFLFYRGSAGNVCCVVKRLAADFEADLSDGNLRAAGGRGQRHYVQMTQNGVDGDVSLVALLPSTTKGTAFPEQLKTVV